MTILTRRQALAIGAVGVGASVTGGIGCRRREPIRVGVLHSMTGTMALSERSVVDATQMGIDEINAAGGLLGRKVLAVIADGRSDDAVFAAEAERLIRSGVSVIFGCWTSAARKSVVAVVERLHHLLVYPVQYEGLEQSPNVIYAGAAPNQQIVPAVAWSAANLGSRFFLVGSDYVFPRTANAIIKDQLVAIGAKLAGETYLPLGATDVASAVKAVVAAKPDVILNTINGDTNIGFFRALRAAGVTAKQTPTMNFSLAEPELRTLDADTIEGDFAAWNYFQSIDSAANRDWVRSFFAKFGKDRVTSDPMEAAWIGTKLWALAVAEAETVDPPIVRAAMLTQSLEAPEGVVAVDPATGHCWKGVRIGRVRRDGQFDIVWDAGRPTRPAPYPIYRTRAEWDRFLAELRQGWGGAWAPPARR